MVTVLTVGGIEGWGELATGTGKDIDAALQQELQALASQHHGKVALYATQLNTGQSVGLDADTVVQTASVIKLTILFEAMEQVRAGKARGTTR